MRRIATFLLILLAGCAPISDGSDIRPVRSPAEKAELATHLIPVNGAYDRLTSSNVSLCGRRCVFIVYLGPANGIGAFTRSTASPPQIWTTFPTMRFLESEAEVALLIAHEWSHILLDHNAPGNQVPNKTAELQADCLGAILTVRAGYDIETAVQSLVRMSRTPNGIMHTLSGGTTHPTWAERIRMTREAGRQGRALDRDGIRRLCGNAP